MTPGYALKEDTEVILYMRATPNKYLQQKTAALFFSMTAFRRLTVQIYVDPRAFY
jgi:hypothetical protein